MDLSQSTAPQTHCPKSRLWVLWSGVFLSVLIYSAVRSPVPGVNEPHYLAKAKHYWDPAWCPGDFFLESSNTHLVFYQTVGVFTLWFPLDAVAWLGRLLALGLIAWGWARLVPHLVPGRWTTLWAMWAYLAIAAVGNWSGEWIIGGVEGKNFSYGFGFWAMALWFERRIIFSACIAGLGVSFHPVVGGWFAIAAAIAILSTAFLRKSTDPQLPKIPLRVWGLAIGIFVLASLPGILPTLELLGHEDLRQAKIVAWIQVFYRLQHHLDPMTFSQSRNVAYGLMAVLWLLARHRLNWGSNERWFAWFVGASIGIALIGVAMGYGERPIASPWVIPLRYRLLKFYPFRLADIMLPVAVAITLAGLAAYGLQGGLSNLWQSPGRARVKCWLAFGSLMIFSLLYPAVDQNPSRMSEAQLRDWIDACEWIREETPADAMVWTPANTWAFKWYAERAEYVSRKDCPQDAEGIIEWNRRMRIHYIGEALKEEPRLTFAILHKTTLPLEPVYQNDHYRIYKLTE
jgi:hypothetical protein